MKRKVLKVIIPVLIIIEICFGYLSFMSFSNRNVNEVKEEQDLKPRQFAMYISDGNGGYFDMADTTNTGSSQNIFPAGYVLNYERSTCVDINDNIIPNILSYSDGKVTVTSNKTAFCYLYFDEDKAVSVSNLVKSHPAHLSTSLVAGMYRYQGTYEEVTNNYLCISKTAGACNSNNSLLYRIIGFDSSNNIKVIKNTDIGNYVWGAPGSHYSYDQSSISSALMQNYGFEATFSAGLSHSEMMQVFKATSWKQGILNVQGGSIKISNNGIELYNVEEKFDATSHESSYIGLMRPSDYYLSLNSTVNCYKNGEECQKSWLHISHNGASDSQNKTEWTMFQDGSFSSGMPVVIINPSGFVGPSEYADDGETNAARPVYYLNGSNFSLKGSGTRYNPYYISF